MATQATNTVSSLVIGYDVNDMTTLRYLVPLAISLSNYIPGHKHRFFHNRIGKKYNSIKHDANWKRYQQIVDGLDFVTTIDKHGAADVECDILVGVEKTDDTIKCSRYVALAHGVDCIDLACKTSCDVYMCGPAVAKLDAVQHLNVVKHAVPPTLLKLSELKAWGRQHMSGEKVVTLFYPDVGHRGVADRVAQLLEDDGFTVYVKQRRKWQPISAQSGKHVYDDMWYPPEAMLYPIASDVVVGFGSSAYLDLVEVGVQYVNVDVLGVNIDPQSEYYSIVHPDPHAIVAAVKERAALNTQPRLMCSEDDIMQMMRSIVQ